MTMKHLAIEKVIGREIIDSRGNPTVEAEVYLADGTVARGAAPSGASTGEFEALELRDNDEKRFQGKGVTKAVENINETISRELHGMDASDIYAIDQVMIKVDGTKDKSNLGANAILAVSIACARAVAKALGTGLSHGVAICDIEVLHNEDNMPAIHLYHGAAARAEELGLGEIQVSISHEKNYAVAVCLGIKKSGRKKKAEPNPL